MNHRRDRSPKVFEHKKLFVGTIIDEYLFKASRQDSGSLSQDKSSRLTVRSTKGG